MASHGLSGYVSDVGNPIIHSNLGTTWATGLDKTSKVCIEVQGGKVPTWVKMGF